MSALGDNCEGLYADGEESPRFRSISALAPVWNHVVRVQYCNTVSPLCYTAKRSTANTAAGVAIWETKSIEIRKKEVLDQSQDHRSFSMEVYIEADHREGVSLWEEFFWD